MRYLSLIALLALGGCAGGKVNPDAGAEQFTLRVLDGTQLDGGSAALDYAVRETGGNVEVQLRAADARGLKACYFELDYDAARLNPVAATSTRLFGGDAGEVVELGVLDRRGTVTHGQVLAKWEERAG